VCAGSGVLAVVFADSGEFGAVVEVIGNEYTYDNTSDGSPYLL
jgi:hypothetical protein